MNTLFDSFDSIKKGLTSIAEASESIIQYAKQASFIKGLHAGMFLQKMLDSNNIDDFERNLLELRSCFEGSQIDINTLSEEAIQEMRSRCLILNKK